MYYCLLPEGCGFLTDAGILSTLSNWAQGTLQDWTPWSPLAPAHHSQLHPRAARHPLDVSEGPHVAPVMSLAVSGTASLICAASADEGPSAFSRLSTPGRQESGFPGPFTEHAHGGCSLCCTPAPLLCEKLNCPRVACAFHPNHSFTHVCLTPERGFREAGSWGCISLSSESKSTLFSRSVVSDSL